MLDWAYKHELNWICECKFFSQGLGIGDLIDVRRWPRHRGTVWSSVNVGIRPDSDL